MRWTQRKINNLGFQTLSPEYRESFVIALENLKQTVRNKLDTKRAKRGQILNLSPKAKLFEGRVIR